MYFNLVKVGSNVCYSNYSSSIINVFCTVDLVSDLKIRLLFVCRMTLHCQGHTVVDAAVGNSMVCLVNLC